MNNNLKAYKGYIGSIQCDFDIGHYYGYVYDTLEPVYYYGDSIEDLQNSFEVEVDAYIERFNLTLSDKIEIGDENESIE